VKLKIPDTTAITAFHTLKRMGFEQLKKLGREDYYEFVVLNESEQFMKDIVNTDVVVNANKHSPVIFKAENEEKNEEIISVVVKDKGNNASGLFSLLRESLGFVHLDQMIKGTRWSMEIEAASKEEKEKIVKEITENLLCSLHYQEYRID
jgi:phosphoribosylformylglycinamidine (FGAM) synthase PurS component